MLNNTFIENIELKTLDMRQSGEMFAFIEKNRNFFIESIPFVSKTKTIQDVEKLIRENLEKQKIGLAMFFTLWEYDKIIGYVLVREINPDAEWAEIGYMIDEHYQGRGIVKGSCIQMINHLFDSMGMQKIVICCNDDNENSKKIAIKLGFKLEGNIRNHFKVNGKIRNMLYYGLLKREFFHRI